MVPAETRIALAGLSQGPSARRQADQPAIGRLGLAALEDYRALLLRDAEEWQRVEAMCRIPISRFYRDRLVFDAIGQILLPEAADIASGRGGQEVRCWSAGCASGEEPYTLVLLWDFVVAPRRPGISLAMVATDIDETMLDRAKVACYAPSSLKDVPREWVSRAFTHSDTLLCLRPEFRERVHFLIQDIRRSMPDGPFELILCRNLAFTYFDETLQQRLLREMTNRLVPRGLLVLGSHERPTAETARLSAVPGLPIYRKAGELQTTNGSRAR